MTDIFSVKDRVAVVTEALDSWERSFPSRWPKLVPKWQSSAAARSRVSRLRKSSRT